jgi:poly(hydroxyalkanoate) depolymerase family esterase
MDEHFAEAMRRSLDLTRAAKPMEATRAIQAALGAGSPTSRTAPGPVTGEASTSPARKRRPLSEVVAGLQKLKRHEGGSVTPDDLQLPEGSRFDQGRHAGPHGARDYRIFLPSPDRPIRGMVMMLHGCTQTALDFALGTQMHQQAERNGWVVIYPEQGRGHNASGCWNWFRPQDQGRSGGEPALLAALAVSVAEQHGIPAEHSFVAGLSAGGAMAAILGQTYPDVFRAVGIHSGLAPGAANDVVSAFAAMRGDPLPSAEALRCPAIIFHGSADATVAPRNAGHLAGRLSDTGERVGQGNTRRCDILSGKNEAGHPMEVWRIAGAGHAWAGGSSKGSYTDPAGPDASAEMARFFRSLG